MLVQGVVLGALFLAFAFAFVLVQDVVLGAFLGLSAKSCSRTDGRCGQDRIYLLAFALAFVLIKLVIFGAMLITDTLALMAVKLISWWTVLFTFVGACCDEVISPGLGV